MPNPTASIATGTASRTSLTASTTAETTRAWSSPAISRRARWWTWRSASMAPARALVPPRSTPTTQDAAMSGHYKDRLVPEPEQPQYTRYRSRPQLFRRTEPTFSGPGSLRGPKRDRANRRPLTAKRVIVWLLIAVGGWLLLSLVLFLVSAQFEQDQVSDAAKNQLSGGGPLPFSANTILVIGSDARPP